MNKPDLSSRKKDHSTELLLIFGGIVALWNFISWDNPFFWDNILNSKIAHWYLQTGFRSLHIPEEYDAGHPPFFSLWLAILWKILGRSLIVSHLAVLPFVIGVVVQFQKLSRRFLPRQAQWIAMLLLVLEPTFLGQSALISGDLPLLFGFLLAVNGFLEQKTIKIGLGLALMAAISVRGFMSLAVVFLLDFGYHWLFRQKKLPWKHLWAYFLVGILILAWLFHHWKMAGWALTPPPETYGTHREIMGIGGMVRNLGITAWRFLDFGRLGLWIAVLPGIVLMFRRRGTPGSQRKKQLWYLFIGTSLFFTLLFIPFSNPIGHRYFMHAYLLLCLLAAAGLAGIEKIHFRIAGTVATALVLLSSIGWIYPPEIAQGWDSSVAHLPYYSLREKMDEYILNSPDLDPDSIGTDFPLVNGSYFTRLTWETWSYQSKNDNKYPYLLESNISNGFSDAELDSLGQFGNLIREEKKAGIYIRLYGPSPKASR